MTLDTFSPCPCGSGKKVKFCCSKNVVAELDKVTRAIDGKQRAAAIDQLDQLITKYPALPAVLALKSTVQLQLGEIEAAETTVESFLEAAPHNSVAFAQSAIIAASKEDGVSSAIKKLQRSLEEVSDAIPFVVFEAIGVVGQALLGQGDLLAARGHFLLQAGLGGADDTRGMSMLLRMNSIPQAPLLLKQDNLYEDCPESAPWSGEFNAAMKCAGRGAWLVAVEQLLSLADKAPDQETIVKNVAIMRGWLGDNEATVASWRSYTKLNDIDLDDAVEAEALAQMLDPATYQDTIDQMRVTYAVADTEKLMEQLLSNRRFSAMPVDPLQAVEEGEPPPKGLFWFCDQEVPTTGEGLTREAVPNVLGELYLFGKQTDRDARLEWVANKTGDFETNKKALVEQAGEHLGDFRKEEKAGTVTAVSAAMTWSWRLPDDTPSELRAQLIKEQRRETTLETWPQLELQVLDGSKAVDVASDEAYRVPLLAAILLLELAGEQNQWECDFNALREQLGLPKQEDLDEAEIDPATIPIVRLARIDPTKLSDENLIRAYRRAVMMSAVHAIKRMTAEVLDRDSVQDEVDRAEAYGILAQITTSSDEALSWIEKAHAVAVENGSSPANWLLAELSVRFRRMEIERVEQLIQRIQTQHIQEPGIAQGLHEMLVQFGVISADGQSRASTSSAVSQTATRAPEAGKIWTPETGEASNEGEEKKSSLWVPGMD